MSQFLQRRRAFVVAAIFALAGCAAAPDPKGGVWRDFLVAAANPAATKAGVEILERGGTAADAAVAIESVLGLVEPQSSGLGGGAFLVYYDAQSGKLRTYDGRETAPAATKPDQFLGPDGKALAFAEQVVGGMSVGVPGAFAMLGVAQKEHGRLPWRDLFAPAITLANSGFIVGPRMNSLIAATPMTKNEPAARAYLYDASGAPHRPGTVLRNSAYAASLRALADNSRALNEGPLAAEISKAVGSAPRHPQIMTLDDLAAYRPKERTPVCAPYRAWRVCSMGPPSSGGIAVLQTLGMLERFDLNRLGAENPKSWHLIAEAERLAYADRATYVADPDFVRVPTNGLVDTGYINARGALIDEAYAFQGIREPGSPTGSEQAMDPGEPYEFPSTTHFTVIDRFGNVAAMTATIEQSFGSEQMAGGFFLNNQLTDFSPVPIKNGKPVANAPAPGKRPMSSMAPVIVFDAAGRPVMAIGSPGGRRIIGYVVKTLVATLDWGMPVRKAIDLPNFMNTNSGTTDIEDNPGASALAASLQAMGHTTRIMTGEVSGLHGFHVVPGGYDGGADKRREGTVAGGRPAPQGLFK
ncbi:MAG: gamma-glutamyltransferase [Alphaproteobacteria bacterium]